MSEWILAPKEWVNPRIDQCVAFPPLPESVLEQMVERGAEALNTTIQPGTFTVRELARACILAALGESPERKGPPQG